MAQNPSNQSVEKAFSILKVLGSSEHSPMRASDIARATGMGASTTGRMLATLEQLGCVSKDPKDQGFSIGSAMFRLASQGLNHNPVHRESRSAAQDLAQRTGLTANVGIREDCHAIYLCHFEGQYTRKSHTMIGMRQPLHASGLGKSLLMDMTQEQREELLGELKAYTEYTITDHALLTEDLEASRLRGWCLEDQDLALGRLCLAVPVRGASGEIVAGIAVSGALSRVREMDMSSLAEQLIEVGDRISVGLGYFGAIQD